MLRCIECHDVPGTSRKFSFDCRALEPGKLQLHRIRNPRAQALAGAFPRHGGAYNIAA